MRKCEYVAGNYVVKTSGFNNCSCYDTTVSNVSCLPQYVNTTCCSENCTYTSGNCPY
jgi:hypothetical protein